MEKYHLDSPASDRIDRLVRQITATMATVQHDDFHNAAAVLAHELPRELRDVLVDFKLKEPSGALLLSGIHVDDDAIGPTPAHWYQPANQVSPALREEIIFSLCAQILGEPFGYATLHNSMLMHNIVPIKGHEQEQIASGSEQPLAWHTEEAFHPCRADYTALMCLRNPYEAPTTYADVADFDIDGADQVILRQSLFRTKPSGSHSARRNPYTDCLPPDQQVLSLGSFQRTEELSTDPPLRSVLFGHQARPYLCVDPDCMTPVIPAAAGALQRLCEEINRKLQDVALAPGDILFIDNYRAIHGRRPFKARFDGTDRWLKRMNITRDLRRSRALRLTADSRIIY
jgi:Fe(II)/alpha-ketoglutarate-dependent arginine beta-hydroxylase